MFVMGGIVAISTFVAAGVHIGDGEEVPQDWTFERMSADVVVDPDGTVQVAETLDVRFDTRPLHGIVRTIPRRGPHSDTHDREVDVEVVAARIVDGPDEVRTEIDADSVRIRTGSETQWLEGPQRIEIVYRIRGAIERDGTGSKLVWNVTGSDWPVPIAAARGTVTMPGLRDVRCFAGTRGSTAGCVRLERGDRTAAFEAGRLAPGEEVTVEAAAAPGFVEAPEARIVRKDDWRAAFNLTPGTIAATFATTVLFLGAAVARAFRGRDVVNDGRRLRRRRLAERFAAPVAFRPPEGLKPAHIGLVENEYVDPDDIAATIIDLAARNHLRIEERQSDDEWEWVLVRQPPPDDPLFPFEERLLDGLFRRHDTMSLHDLEGAFDRDYDAVAARLYNDAVDRGWFVDSPHRVRRRFAVIGIFGTLAAAIAFVAAYETTTWALPFVPPLLAAGFVLAFFWRMPARGAKGSRLLSEVRGLRRYLSTAEVETMRFAQDQGALLELLPYAVALGLTDRWSKIIGDVAGEMPDARGLRSFVRTGGDMQHAVDNFTASAGACLSASPGVTGGGGGSSSAAGGGFGGGGGRAW